MAIADSVTKWQALIQGAMEYAVTSYETTGRVELSDTLNERVRQALLDTWSEAGRAEGSSVMEQFKAGYVHLESKDDTESLYNRILEEYVAQFGALRVAQITDATREQVRRVIDSGLKSGQSVAEIVKELRGGISEFSRLRAHIIARTETHSASQYASLGVARASRLTLVKRWVAASDHRTRDFGEGDGIIDSHNHRAMSGVTVALDSPFMVPTKRNTLEPLMYPGDPNGTAGNVINCRCAMVYKKA